MTVNSLESVATVNPVRSAVPMFSIVKTRLVFPPTSTPPKSWLPPSTISRFAAFRTTISGTGMGSGVTLRSLPRSNVKSGDRNSQSRGWCDP